MNEDILLYKSNRCETHSAVTKKGNVFCKCINVPIHLFRLNHLIVKSYTNATFK